MLKYFLDVSEEEQERRFRQRIDDPLRQWKLSPMDLELYRRWWDYTTAYDEMIRMTDTAHAPWWIVPSDDKKAARINCITHLLKSIPYERSSSRAQAREAAKASRGFRRGHDRPQRGAFRVLKEDFHRRLSWRRQPPVDPFPQAGLAASCHQDR